MATPRATPKRYLTFRVARRDFAIDAARVRAILPPHELTPVPLAHPCLAGIASLGGRTVAVFDLRARLRLAPASAGRRPKIVVIEVTTGAGRHLAGFVADRVTDVATLRDRAFSHGAFRGGARPRYLLDPDQLLSEDELIGLWAANP